MFNIPRVFFASLKSYSFTKSSRRFYIFNYKFFSGVIFLVNVPHAGALAGIKRLEIVFMLQDKGHNKINDHRAAKSKKGEVNKVHPHGSGLYTQMSAQPLANAKSPVLKPLCDPVYHKSKDTKITGAQRPFQTLFVKQNDFL